MKRSAFTLLELLVVIALISVLATLLLTAISRARETARRTQCIARQSDLVKALITYENDNGGLPGYLNQLGSAPIHSWVVAVLPNVGENKRYEVLMKGQTLAEALVSPPTLLCPSNSRTDIAPLNYVVNCGPDETLLIQAAEERGVKTGDLSPSFTLFKDRRSPLALNINKKVSIADIPDGASSTILLSENVDAGIWHQIWLTHSDVPAADRELLTESDVFTRDKAVTKNLGFIWSPLRSKTTSFMLNALTDDPRRPSSKHPGTVIAAFADGAARVINDEIAIEEWFKAVCPDDGNFPLP